jgi:hypothetical protein
MGHAMCMRETRNAIKISVEVSRINTTPQKFSALTNIILNGSQGEMFKSL